MTGDPRLPVNHPGHPPDREHLVLTEVPVPGEAGCPPGALTLRAAQARYGFDGTITSPFSGRRARFSLEEWRESDPDDTYLTVSFAHVDPAKVGTVLPEADRHELRRMERPKQRVEFDFE